MPRTFSLAAGVPSMAPSRLPHCACTAASRSASGCWRKAVRALLEGRQDARGIDLAALAVRIGGLRRLDAMLGGLRLALVLGHLADDGGDLALEADDARGDAVALASAPPSAAARR